MPLHCAVARPKRDSSRHHTQRILWALGPLFILSAVAGCAENTGASIQATSQDPGYSWPDSFFMLDTKPVQVVVSGAVSGLSETSLRRSVAAGMESAAPITCCAQAGDDFKAKAPLVFTPGITSVGGRYHVVWRFQEVQPVPIVGSAAPLVISASAELYRGGDPLTRAQGRIIVRAGDSAGSERAMVELVRKVEKRLTPFPNWWMGGGEGGG
jgi:hypothetical protein